jgi:hypothetical protein
MEIIKKSSQEILIKKNGIILKNSKIQSYEDNQKKIMKGQQNGNPFLFIQNKKQFRPVPKHVHFQSISNPYTKSSKRYRTPTPYPNYHYNTSSKKQNKTQNKKRVTQRFQKKIKNKK